MAPNYPEPSKITWCEALCPSSVLDTRCSTSSYLGRLSLCCLPNRSESSMNSENGPDGIRSGICDLDRVLCSRYTTGPVLSLRNDGGYSKIVDHNFSRRVSNRDKCIVDSERQNNIPTQMRFPPDLLRHIFDMSRDVPLIAKSVLHASAAIAVGLVLWLGNGGRSYCQRAPVERVAIGNV